MSGVEVIGLVLGAFPLCISALEHYRESYKVLGTLGHFEREWRKALNDIKDEYLLYKLNLQLLLLPVVDEEELTEDDIETLLTDFKDTRWKGSDVQELLRSSLGDSYKRFLEIAQELQSLIEGFLTIIGIDKPRLQAKLRASKGAACPTDPASKLRLAALKEVLKTCLDYRKEQLKFGFGQAQRDELLKEIRINNKKLDRMLEKSAKIARYQESRTVAIPRRAVKSLVQYWQDADRIYTLIHRSWGCQCMEKHCAYLWLQHRTAATFEFRLLVLWSPQCLAVQPFPPWQSQGLRITRLQGSFGTTKPGNPAPTNVRVRKKAVQFIVPSIQSQDDAQDAKSKKLKGTLADSTPQNPVHEIMKLCTAMGTCNMQQACIGALTDAEKGNQYSVHSQPEQKVMAGETTLRDILLCDDRRALSRSERYTIALAVASSHLQLHSTPWARRQWEAQDIRFPSSGSGATDIMFDRPYVSADFARKLPAQEQTARRSDRSFACLGIMLLELLFGKSLEDHELWGSPGFGDNKSSTIFRLMIAREWAVLVEGEAGPDFSAAVMWCLNESPTTLEGMQWREDLANKVVLPLQNCCDWIKGRQATAVQQ